MRFSILREILAALLLSLGLTLLVGLSQAGCGFDFGLGGVWDDRCYDCRTVCEGTTGDVQNACLAACSECQGSSECFSLMEGRFEGMSNAQPDWDVVDCTQID